MTFFINRLDMSSSLASKIKMAAIFLFSRFGTQFFAFEPPMYVSFKGNYHYWPNMVFTMIYIGKTCPGLFSPPPCQPEISYPVANRVNKQILFVGCEEDVLLCMATLSCLARVLAISKVPTVSMLEAMIGTLLYICLEVKS